MTKPSTPREPTHTPLPSGPIPVETSQGRLYVRHLGVGDYSSILELQSEAPDALLVGRATLLRSCSAADSRQDWIDLPEETFDALTDTDLQVLGATVAKENDIDELPEGLIVQSIGEAVIGQAKELQISIAKTVASMNASLSWIGESSRSGIADSLLKMSKLSQSLKLSPALDSLRNLGNIGTPPLSVSVLQKVAADPQKDVARRPFDVVPSVESLPMGRAAKAAEETSQQVALVVTQLAEMGTLLSKMANTLLTTALPEWLGKLKEDRKKEKIAVYIAIGTLIFSVLVSIATTYWQIRVGEKYQKDNDEQQQKIMETMNKQLATSDALRQKMADDAKALRDQLTVQKGAHARH